MKLSNIEGHEAIELFPIEIAPVNPRTAAYLDHNAIPVQFTNEDFDQVATGNYVTKVIYLPRSGISGSGTCQCRNARGTT